MGSFLQKLRSKNIVPPPAEGAEKTDKLTVAPATDKKEAPPVSPEVGLQLSVDIHRTPTSIVVYAQVAGAGVHDFAVLVEGDEDILTIKGQRLKPDGVTGVHEGQSGAETLLQECAWGKFYRQIILPSEVDSSRAEARIKNGVLVVTLPLKNASESAIRIEVKEF